MRGSGPARSLEMQLDLFTEKKELNDYERKQLEKALRYQDRAKSAAAQSESTLKQVRRERDMIPLGQPILVGHHSEKRHRNHLKRLENRERRGWEEHDKLPDRLDDQDHVRPA